MTLTGSWLETPPTTYSFPANPRQVKLAVSGGIFRYGNDKNKCHLHGTSGATASASAVLGRAPCCSRPAPLTNRRETQNRGQALVVPPGSAAKPNHRDAGSRRPWVPRAAAFSSGWLRVQARTGPLQAECGLWPRTLSLGGPLQGPLSRHSEQSLTQREALCALDKDATPGNGLQDPSPGVGGVGGTGASLLVKVVKPSHGRALLTEETAVPCALLRGRLCQGASSPLGAGSGPTTSNRRGARGLPSYRTVWAWKWDPLQARVLPSQHRMPSTDPKHRPGRQPARRGNGPSRWSAFRRRHWSCPVHPPCHAPGRRHTCSLTSVVTFSADIAPAHPGVPESARPHPARAPLLTAQAAARPGSSGQSLESSLLPPRSRPAPRKAQAPTPEPGSPHRLAGFIQPRTGSHLDPSRSLPTSAEPSFRPHAVQPPAGPLGLQGPLLRSSSGVRRETTQQHAGPAGP